MPKKNKDQRKPVGEAFRIAVNVTIKKLLNSEDTKEWEYPSSFTAEERAYIHIECKKRGLKSKSRGKGSNRYITIYKREGSAIVQKDATINLTQASRSLLYTLFNKQPVTTRERQDCLPPLERTKDSFQDGKEQSRALGRLGGGSPQVPAASNNRALAQFRASLPVHALRDTILHTINDNQVTIVTGPTGSGKTTQVPQYLLEWHERVGRPCRIFCTQPRRISAVSVSERVAIERSEKLGQTVGYQIRLEGKVSPYTVLTYCTTGVLLRTLMTGDGVLASVTHVMLDEVHERDRLTDFLLIVLREVISKYRALRIIIMSATLDTERLSTYFNNSPIITVPGKCYGVKEFFLEDILKQTGYLNSKMETLKKELDKKKEQATALEKWTAEVMQQGDKTSLKETIIVNNFDYEVNEEMEDLLMKAWNNGSQAYFTQMLELIQKEIVPVDYQHSKSRTSAMMAASFWGNVEAVKELIALGSSLTLRAENGFSPIDWAIYRKRIAVLSVLEEHMDSDIIEEVDMLRLDSEQKVKDSNSELIQLYHTLFDDENIDMKLIVALVTLIHSENTKGSILIFLPGYDDIITLKDLLLQEEKKLSQKMKILILMLHSNMQTCDQKTVFKSPPAGTRKIILSTNIAETSLTIDDVLYVIDSGKVKENTYNSLSGVSQLCTVWVSKSCAIQRKGRAGRTQPGFCYHLYSSTRYDSMDQYKTPEILRTPIIELSLYAKQLAPPNTSIVDFLSRALDPPSSLVSRSSVALLKTIDALDTWEDLTDLGHHLLDIPLDPRYGKMLIYASVLKCLDPVLTIVCCLTFRDLFVIPTMAVRRKDANRVKKEFAAGSLSDHMVLLRVFQGWQEARKQCRERAFCDEHFINGATMEMILGTRAQVLAQLRASGFVKSKGPGDIKYVNMNSDNWAVVKAALVGGLYPNIARVDRDHSVLRTQKEHKVIIHPSSVLSNGKNGAEKLPTDWVMHEDMVRGWKLAQIKTATVISPITVAIFAGPSKIPYDAISDTTMEGSVGSDSEEEEVAPEHTAMVKLDEWLIFRMDSDSAQLALQLRIKWHSLLTKKLRSTSKMLTNIDELVITTIVRVLSAEEHSAGLTQPAGVGRRPYLMNPDLPAKRYGSGNKGIEADTPSPTPSYGSSDMSRASLSPFRYFVIKAGQIKAIEASVNHKAWAFSQNTHNKIVQAYKSGKTVILVFSIQGSGHFQGYAKLSGDSAMPCIPELGANPPLPIEWIKKAAVPYQSTRHLLNPYNDNTRIQTSRDGQEIEPSVGESLCLLWETMGMNNQYGQQRNSRGNPRQTHVYHNTNYKM